MFRCIQAPCRVHFANGYSRFALLRRRRRLRHRFRNPPAFLREFRRKNPRTGYSGAWRCLRGADTSRGDRPVEGFRALRAAGDRPGGRPNARRPVRRREAPLQEHIVHAPTTRREIRVGWGRLRAGRNRVDAHSSPGDLGGQRAGHAETGALGGGVGHDHRDAEERGH